MSNTFYINHSVSVRNNTVKLDDALFFNLTGTDAGSRLASLYKKINPKYPRFYKMDQLSKLGWICAEILLDNEFKHKQYPPDRVAIILSNANASLDTDIRYYDSVKEIASPALFVYTLPNIVAGEISIRHQLKGENAFFIFADFNSSFIHQYVNAVMENNDQDASICGWVEVLGEEMSCVLYLVEKTPGPKALPFSVEIMNQIFYQ